MFVLLKCILPTCKEHLSEVLRTVVCDTAQMFLTSKFSYLLFFPTLPIKLKLRLQIGAGWETTNTSKAPGPMIMIDQSETQTAAMRPCVYIAVFSSCRVLGFCCACYVPASGKGAKMLGQDHFVEPNRLVLTFLHPIFICRVTN
jgi:hypothetical protein